MCRSLSPDSYRTAPEGQGNELEMWIQPLAFLRRQRIKNVVLQWGGGLDIQSGFKRSVSVTKR